MSALSESILKKLSKKDLIEIIIKLQESPKESQRSGAMTLEEFAERADQQLKKMAENRDPNETPRPSTHADYICIRCERKFNARIGLFLKDINDPVCEDCKSRGYRR